MNISFIGFGNIAKSIAKGLMHDKSNKLRASAPSLPIGIDGNGIQTCHDNLSVLPHADILILTVKPPQMRAVMEQISTVIPEGCLIISVATGINLCWFANYIPSKAVVRAMPNIAAAIGKSATPLIANENATNQQKQWAEQIFNRLGIITWAQKESDIDTFTALSGSGPAYVFLFMESMIKSAVKLGIAKDVATSFTIQTFNGALNLVTESELDIVELRKTVTSPAGTTAAAIEIFTQHGIDKLIDDAINAACKRAKVLGEAS